jgi:hypothetical protein
VPLLTIADKLLGKQNLAFEQSTLLEQQLWKLFETNEIYKFLMGETNTIPEFHFNWITCSHGIVFKINPYAILDGFNFQHPHQPGPHPVQWALLAPSPTPAKSHNLHPRKSINYKALHLSQELQQAGQQLKWGCKYLSKTVKAAITK